MPVTSSHSSLKRWPSADRVLGETLSSAQRLADVQPTLVAVGCFGAPRPDLLGADVAALPVPTDVLHYTEGEFRALLERRGRMANGIAREARWWVGGPARTP